MKNKNISLLALRSNNKIFLIIHLKFNKKLFKKIFINKIKRYKFKNKKLMIFR